MIKINPLDAHDRLKHLKASNPSIEECCVDLINQAPYGNRPFYIFVHARTEDNGIDTRLIWQPRLTKPKAQTNSMLFKGYPGNDKIDVIWIIPKRELWAQYQRGKLTESETIHKSIDAFLYDRARLEAPDESDPGDEEVDGIYQQLAIEAKRNKLMAKLYTPA